MSGWTLWILASAFFLALYDLAKKASVRENAVLPVLLVSTLFGCTAFAGTLAVTGRLAAAVSLLNARLLALGAAKSAIVGTSWIFTFCALRTLPITIATPIRASAPALVFVLALFLYGECPTLLQGLGMLAVFTGYFVFSWAGRHEGIDFFRNRAVWFAIIGAFFSAVSSVWDKCVFQVLDAPVEPTQLVFQVGLVLFYPAALVVIRLFRRSSGSAGAYAFEFRWSIPLVGILLAAADWLFFSGVAIDGVPISVASLMRRFSVVITFLFGARLFHETNLRRKALALAAILVGIVLCAVK